MPDVTGARIVFVEFAPSGGLFQFSVQLGEALARRGDEVEVITGPRPELDSRESGCRVTSVLPTWHPTAGSDAPEWWRRARRGVRAGQYVAGWLTVIAVLVARRPDVVVWSSWRFSIDGWGVLAVRKVLPAAVLALIAHEPRPLREQAGDGLYKDSDSRALTAAHRALDVAYVLGESAREALVATWPLAAPVQVIPHGDEGVFGQASLGPVDETGPVALCFGTIRAYKGIDVLFKAWPEVLRQLPGARLVLAGAVNPDVDKEWLRESVARLAGVELHEGYVELEGVAAYFARARVVVLPYRRGSQSGVAHVAHTFGRPVVCTRVGDIPAVVHDGISGLVVPPGDVGGLAAALVRLLAEPEFALRLGSEGRRQLSLHASWDEVAEAFDSGLAVVPARGDGRT